VTTTTSTTLPGACQGDGPDGCDDGDRCTDDACVDGACVNLPREGLAAASCRLDGMDAALGEASPGDVGGAAARARLLAKVGAVRRIVDGAVLGDAHSRGPLLRGVRLLRSFAATVARSGRRGKLRADLAARLGDDGGRAVQALLAAARR
jgi:hypothetical protein